MKRFVMSWKRIQYGESVIEAETIEEAVTESLDCEDEIVWDNLDNTEEPMRHFIVEDTDDVKEEPKSMDEGEIKDFLGF